MNCWITPAIFPVISWHVATFSSIIGFVDVCRPQHLNDPTGKKKSQWARFGNHVIKPAAKETVFRKLTLPV